MCYADSTLRLVDMLPASATCTKYVDANVTICNLDRLHGVSVVGQHGDSGCAGVQAPLCLRLRDALNAMDACFVLDEVGNIWAGDAENEFFDATARGIGTGERTEFPFATSGEAGIHEMEIMNEEGSFFASGTCAKFEDG